MLAVLEKDKAVTELAEAVGRFEVKNQADYDRCKKKANSSAALFGASPETLVQEYGPHLFAFPFGGAAANQRKILRFFSSLPNSAHFEIT